MSNFERDTILLLCKIARSLDGARPRSMQPDAEIDAIEEVWQAGYMAKALERGGITARGVSGTL